MEYESNGLDEQKEFRLASPTLIIGLGGTGAEVLSRVRDRFFSTLGPLENFPVIRYLWLDTDTVQGTHTSSWYKQYRQMSQQLKFQRHEKVELTVPDTELYLSHLSEYPHIQRWIYPHLSGKTSITEGAGQIRAYGRLAFFHNIEAIQSRIQSALQSITTIDAGRRSRENGLQVNSESLNVIIVGSVAGGTGSGTYLDMAYLVRKSLRDLALPHKINLVGFLALPSVFGGPAEMPRLYANGYAALKELNHFNYSPPAEKQSAGHETQRSTEHDYELWFSAGDRPVQMGNAPFDICYLVDGRNTAGVAAGGKDNETLYTMIAENIFFDFSMSDFGTEKRSTRDNLLQWLGKQSQPLYKDEAEELKLPKRHFAFGLATITFPYERVMRALSAKLAADIVDYWGRKSDDQVDAVTHFETFLSEIGFLENGIGGPRPKRNVLDALYAHPEGGLIQYSVMDKVGQAAREMKELGNHRSSQPWAELLRDRRAAMDREWNGEKSDDPKLWGDAVRIMRFNQDQYLKGLKERLDEAVQKLVNDDHRGIGFAMTVLESLSDRINRSEDGYIAVWQKEQRMAAENMAALREEMEGYLADLDEHWRMSNWTMLRGTTLEKDLAKYEEAAKNYYQVRVQFLARELAVGAARQVELMISADDRSGWLYKLSRLQKVLNQVKRHLDERVIAYSQSTPDPRTILLYTGVKDLERIYQRYVPSADKVAKELNEEALRTLELKLMELPDHAVDLSLLGDRLCRVTAARFSKVADDYDAFTLFHDQYETNTAEWDSKIEEMLKACQNWITFEQGHTGLRETMKSEQARFIVGFSLTGDDSRRRVEFADRLLDRFNEVAQKKKVNLGNKHQIVFYCEVAGYALCQTRSVRSMREQYLKVLSEGARDLHIDKRDARFSELVVLDREEKEQLSTAARAFLLGSILGIIRPVPWKDGRGNTDIAYEYLEKRDGRTPEPRWLGNDNSVIPFLRSRPEMRAKIDLEILNLLTDVNTDPESMAEYAALLRVWVEQYYKPRQIDSGNSTTEKILSLENRVLDSELSMLMSRSAALVKQMAQEKHDIIGTAADNFTEENLAKRRVLKTAQTPNPTPSRFG
ncbi:MAG: hypothetical protein K0R39_3275 [Symbiobacteriaceae bacterium]|jgi:hypothetical protein|nr:hypothetical protein [Symbiobacteriaceae bacterium]